MIDLPPSVVIHVVPFAVEVPACLCNKNCSMDGCCLVLQCPLLLCEVTLSSDFCYSSVEFGDLRAVKIVVLSFLSCVWAQWAAFC